jgi:bacterioferritin-associated ferredoxin
MTVDRCVCLNVTFEVLLAHHREHGGDFEDLQRAYGCGRGCGYCRPYILDMLSTGRTRFEPRPMDSTAPAEERLNPAK